MNRSLFRYRSTPGAGPTGPCQGGSDPEAVGFTLIELLVVMAIVAILASFLMPALGKAQAKARHIACVNNLRQLGIAVRTYAEDRQGTLPAAELLPSQPQDPGAPLPRIADLLASELGTAPATNPSGSTSSNLNASVSSQSGSGVFRCPADRGDRWKREGSSYEWNTELNGRRLDEPRNAHIHIVAVIRDDSGGENHMSTNRTLEFPPHTTPLLYNYDPLHPRPPRSPRNSVFMDGHVESLDAMLR